MDILPKPKERKQRKRIVKRKTNRIMKIIKKHCKKSDSWLYCCFVAHDGFGLKPRLKISFIDRSGLYFYFLFTFWRFEIYRCRVKKVTDNDKRSI
jgi:peroxiredoxin family protein